AGLALHSGRERHLKAQRALDRQRRRKAREAARGAIDHVDAQRLQLLGEGHSVLDLPATGAVDRRDADEHRLVRRPALAHGARTLRSEVARLIERAWRAALAAGMGDLRAGQRTFLLEEAHQPLVALDLAVVPHAEIALGDPAARLDGAVLGEHDAELAQREFA